jgi:hypothetical protein
MNTTVFNNHPIIPNANQYFYEKKYISIHSEDRDVTKYPNSAQFEIELPQDYLNIASARLYSWAFPANYNVFSVFNFNISMTFKFTNLYNPGAFDISDTLLQGIFAALYSTIDQEFIVIIEPGFYNPNQMANELTNQFNASITNQINLFFNNNPDYAAAKNLFTIYDRFKIVYNTVTQKLWFGNSADQFVLTNDSNLYFKRDYVDSSCARRNVLPNFSNWGLPAYLGFTRCPAYSVNADEFLNLAETQMENIYGDTTGAPINISLINQKVPRFYYGDVSTTGDNGYWILPGAPDATVYFLQAPLKISFMGPAYIYMEVDGLNCIDETSPWNLSNFTAHTNGTNGIVNSAFAKIPIPTTPISQWFDGDLVPYKYFNPPAERLRKLNIRLRYHNGQNVDFGNFEYSFMIEFNILRPQQERSYSIRSAYDLGQMQSYGK